MGNYLVDQAIIKPAEVQEDVFAPSVTIYKSPACKKQLDLAMHAESGMKRTAEENTNLTDRSSSFDLSDESVEKLSAQFMSM